MGLVGAHVVRSVLHQDLRSVALQTHTQQRRPRRRHVRSLRRAHHLSSDAAHALALGVANVRGSDVACWCQSGVPEGWQGTCWKVILAAHAEARSCTEQFCILQELSSAAAELDAARGAAAAAAAAGDEAESGLEAQLRDALAEAARLQARPCGLFGQQQPCVLRIRSALNGGFSGIW